MAFADSEPTTQADPTVYSTPSNSDLAAVATTVTLVGVVMAILITWLAVRLRRAAHSEHSAIPIVARRPASAASYTFRPSFAPSEASSKFGFSACLLPIAVTSRSSSVQFANLSGSLTETKTAAGTLLTQIPFLFKKRAYSTRLSARPPQNTVQPH